MTHQSRYQYGPGFQRHPIIQWRMVSGKRQYDQVHEKEHNFAIEQAGEDRFLNQEAEFPTDKPVRRRSSEGNQEVTGESERRHAHSFMCCLLTSQKAAGY